MSEPAERRWRQQHDRVAARPAVILIAGTLAVIAGSVAVSWWLLRRDAGGGARVARIDARGPRAEVSPGAASIGGVRQTLIERDEETARLLHDQRRRLESFAWVDRDRGIVRIPIERAMDLAAAGMTPVAPATPPAATAAAATAGAALVPAAALATPAPIGAPRGPTR